MFNLVEKFIGQPGKIKIWLGMERLSSDSKLHWIDNEPIAYENWAPGEPDQTGACVQMIHKGWWEDTSCEQQLPYVCKKGESLKILVKAWDNFTQTQVGKKINCEPFQKKPHERQIYFDSVEILFSCLQPSFSMKTIIFAICITLAVDDEHKISTNLPRIIRLLC